MSKYHEETDTPSITPPPSTVVAEQAIVTAQRPDRVIIQHIILPTAQQRWMERHPSIDAIAMAPAMKVRDYMDPASSATNRNDVRTNRDVRSSRQCDRMTTRCRRHRIAYKGRRLHTLAFKSASFRRLADHWTSSPDAPRSTLNSATRHWSSTHRYKHYNIVDSASDALRLAERPSRARPISLRSPGTDQFVRR